MNSEIFIPYVYEIERGLCQTEITEGKGIIIGLDSGLERWVDKSEELRAAEGLFFFCGNGASASIAEHFSHDCFQNADFLTQTVSETSHITAIANDLSYEDVFSYRINKVMKAGDMLITISSSGNSPNIIKAIDTARKKRAFIVTLSGKGKDNKSRQLGDINVYVPLDTYGLVESAHAMIMHMWLDRYLDKYKGGRH